jgi:hypothetical protein
MQELDKPLTAENHTSGKSEHEKRRADGIASEVPYSENLIKKEAEAEEVEEIADISADINAEIVEASKKEREQKKLDEENGNDFEIYESEEQEEANSKLKIFLLVGGVVGFGVLVAFSLKNRLRVGNETQLRELLDNGTQQEQTIDKKSGFIL